MEAFDMINKDHKAGKRNRYAFIPKNNKEQCVVIEDIEINDTITKYRQVFNLKDLRYSTSLNEIIETKPVSQKLFTRNLFNRDIGNYSSVTPNGTTITITNDLVNNKIRRTSTINSKDYLSKYEKIQYFDNNGEKIITETVNSHGKFYFKSTSENKLLHLDENFEEQKQLAFENFKK